MTYSVGDKIEFEHVVWGLDFNGEPTVFKSWTVVPATITRVWANGKYVTLRTLSDQIYVRAIGSESIRLAPKVTVP
jgi:hypothetical protein